jgi:prephenate dehydrogenase
MSRQDSLGIVGLGVMGGSLALAWKRAVGGTVRAFSPDRADAAEARAAGAVDVVCETVLESAAGVDWWIIATPIGALPEVWAAVESAPPGRAMDVASLQAPALRAAEASGAASRAVTAHPMVGREGSGFRAADARLYDGAAIWLSASDRAAAPLRSAAEAFWSRIGARPAWIEASLHDDRMVGASHLPQLTANALARVMAGRGLTPGDLGPGGLDMTRLAASSPVMWRDLLGESAPLVTRALESLSEEIDALRRMLEDGDLDALSDRMAETRHWRTPT